MVSLLWDVGQLACRSAPASQLQWGLPIHVPQRTDPEQQTPPSAFWPLSHDLSVGLHLQIESARIWPSDVLQRKKIFNYF